MGPRAARSACPRSPRDEPATSRASKDNDSKACKVQPKRVADGKCPGDHVAQMNDGGNSCSVHQETHPSCEAEWMCRRITDHARSCKSLPAVASPERHKVVATHQQPGIQFFAEDHRWVGPACSVPVGLQQRDVGFLRQVACVPCAPHSLWLSWGGFIGSSTNMSLCVCGMRCARDMSICAISSTCPALHNFSTLLATSTA